MSETEKAQGLELLTVVSTITDGITVLTATGEMDHTSTGRLAQALKTGGLGGPPYVVVDLGHVTFIDSSGINVLLTAHRGLAEADGWLRLARVPDSVMRTLEIVGIDAVIPCYPGLREALAA
ncbi:STAS domain-containing protein [Streptomyces naphthomycinicus]|uniref:STAS domain-containing protein n=1 Tax=Streptomyces naphthomycinicus TaxID=2872625 RepID=UPI001CECE67A|nr:STAS domain-containing protein [Streptomyces sp. TML10]